MLGFPTYLGKKQQREAGKNCSVIVFDDFATAEEYKNI